VEAEGEAAGDGAAGVEVCLKEDTKESHRRVHPNIHLAKVLEEGRHEEGVGVEVRQHHAVGG
jgi:hypothetical protein